jgi:hypothetical protein
MANGQSLADEGTSAAGFNFEAGTTGTYTVDADCRGSGELHLPLYANAPGASGRQAQLPRHYATGIKGQEPSTGFLIPKRSWSLALPCFLELTLP